MARRLVDGPERLGKAACAWLKLHEVPTKLPSALDGDCRKRLRRPFLAVGVAPRAYRRSVGDSHRERSLNPCTAAHPPSLSWTCWRALRRLPSDSVPRPKPSRCDCRSTGASTKLTMPSHL